MHCLQTRTQKNGNEPEQRSAIAGIANVCPKNLYIKINVQKCVKVWGRIRPAFRPLHKVNEIRVMQEKCNNNRAGGNPLHFFAEGQKVKPVLCI